MGATDRAPWAERDRRPFAWLSVDEDENDPTVLLTYLAAALDRIESIDPAVFDALASPGASTTAAVVLRLGASLSATAAPVVVVLDDVHLLQNRECLDAVAALIEDLPPGSQLALAGQAEPPLPLAGLRARGRVLEIGREDLAMRSREASLLLQAADVDLSGLDADELVRRTAGCRPRSRR